MYLCTNARFLHGDTPGHCTVGYTCSDSLLGADVFIGHMSDSTFSHVDAHMIPANILYKSALQLP